jgi:hypothetical protein
MKRVSFGALEALVGGSFVFFAAADLIGRS